MPDIISVIIALVLVIVAAVHDLREFRIPNRLIVAGIVAGVSVIVIRAFTGEYIGNYILGTLVGLAGMIFLYIIRAVGAGDVKLLAVIGMLTGLDFVLQLMAVSLITGLFTGIVELFFKKDQRGQYGEQWNKGAWVSLCSGGSGWICCCVGIQVCCGFMNDIT